MYPPPGHVHHELRVSYGTHAAGEAQRVGRRFVDKQQAPIAFLHHTYTHTHTHTHINTRQSEMKRQQTDIDALARRNTE